MTANSDNHYDLNDLQSDIAHLGHLLETITATIMDCDFGPPGARVPHMDRLQALIWISRDMAQTLNERVTSNYVAIGSTTTAAAKCGG